MSKKKKNLQFNSYDPDNVIFYTTTDNTILNPSSTKFGDATLISNTYEEGLGGVMEFDKTLTIVQGQGPIFQQTPEKITKVKLPRKVEEIGNFAFLGCTNLNEINIPKLVKKIGDMAFSYCRTLSEIILPDGIKTISSQVFFDCQKLEKINLPNTLTKIGDLAFSSCTSLTSISFPNSITEIGTNVLQNTTSLKRVEYNASCPLAELWPKSGWLVPFETLIIGDDVPSIQNQSCRYLQCLKELYIGKKITEIPAYCFGQLSTYTQSMEKLVIPGNIKKIGQDAFQIGGFRTVEIEEGVPYIGYSMFYQFLRMESITIPISVKEIESSSFLPINSSFTTINYRGTKEQWEAIKMDNTTKDVVFKNVTINYNYKD